ncbi:translation initiation factor eIF-2B subunit epsilon [Pancytospora epiphaga]|nr:translation initiation factor eIF-2B subunit epsilon [Pancytospora epiphaga]
MEITREFITTALPVVLLVCDYYEVAKSAKDKMVRDAALFPVGKVTLVDLILNNLAEQNFNNVIIAGRKIDPIVKHVSANWKDSGLNIAAYKSSGETLGDMLREMHSSRIEMGDVLIMYANTYTNMDLTMLWKRHKESNGRNILTLCTYEKNTTDDAVHVYGTNGCRVLFYQKLEGDKLDSEDIFHTLLKHKSISVDFMSSSPTIAVASPDVFTLFNDNFDYQTLGDLMVGELANEYQDGVFEIVKDSGPQILAELGAWCCRGTESDRFMNVRGFTQPKRIYSREILTVHDLSNLIADVRHALIHKQAVIDSFSDKIPGGHVVHVTGQFVDALDGPDNDDLAERSLWDSLLTASDTSCDALGFSAMSSTLYNLNNIECDNGKNSFEISLDEEESEVAGKESQSFFVNVYCLLYSHVTSPTLYDTNIDDLNKQVSLLRIVWNASCSEAIEAFGQFFVKMLDLENLEDSLSKASVFFDILSTYIVSRQDEELLMETIYNNIHNIEYDLKVQILFNYGFLFVQSGVVDKSVVKRYNKMYKANVL